MNVAYLSRAAMKARTCCLISTGVLGDEPFDEIPSEFVPTEFEDGEFLEPDCCDALS